MFMLHFEVEQYHSIFQHSLTLLCRCHASYFPVPLGLETFSQLVYRNPDGSVSRYHYKSVTYISTYIILCLLFQNCSLQSLK